MEFIHSTHISQSQPWEETTNEEEVVEADMEEDGAEAVAVAEVDAVERLIPTTTRIGMAFNGVIGNLYYIYIYRSGFRLHLHSIRILTFYMVYLSTANREAGAESAHDMVRGGDEAKSGMTNWLVLLTTFIDGRPNVFFPVSPLNQY